VTNEPTTGQPDEPGLRYDPASGSLLMPADWLPRTGDIPADQLTAILTNAVDLADGIRLGYRAGRALSVGRCGHHMVGLVDVRPMPVCALPAGHAGWHKGDDGAEWSRGPDLDDPLVVAVLDAAIVLAQDLAATMEPTSDLERNLIAAVNAMLAARHTPAEPGKVTRDLDDLIAEQSAHDPEFARGVHDAEAKLADNPPVTPAADLADEAAHERVARAIQGYLNGDEARETWANAYAAAKAAIDAYRAGPTHDASQPGNPALALRVIADGLHARGITVGALPQRIAEATLATIDRLTTALNDAARGELLEAELDGGLTADQEIRGEALTAATRTMATGTLEGDEITVRDYEQTTVGIADRYAEWITTGGYDWQAAGTSGQPTYGPDAPCTCPAAPCEHPHSAPYGCGAADCGCRWFPPPLDPDDPWADTAPSTAEASDA
jgi:hypothetical protein